MTPSAKHPSPPPPKKTTSKKASYLKTLKTTKSLRDRTTKSGSRNPAWTSPLKSSPPFPPRPIRWNVPTPWETNGRRSHRRCKRRMTAKPRRRLLVVVYGVTCRRCYRMNSHSSSKGSSHHRPVSNTRPPAENNTPAVIFFAFSKFSFALLTLRS